MVHYHNRQAERLHNTVCEPLPIHVGLYVLTTIREMEAMGFTIDPRGNWSLYAEAVAKEARKRLGAIRRIAHNMLDDRAKMMDGLQGFCNIKD